MKKEDRKTQYSDSKIYCNCCGQIICKKGCLKEDYLHVRKDWGYFSFKDLTGHAFNMCEACYDQMISNFKIPVEEFPIDEIPDYTDEELKALNEAYAIALGK